MRTRDLYTGTIVYHSLFVHWGKGKVIKIRQKDNLGYRTSKKYLVKWTSGRIKGVNDEVWCKASDLRKTFDEKKAKLLQSLMKHDSIQ